MCKFAFHQFFSRVLKCFEQVTVGRRSSGESKIRYFLISDQIRRRCGDCGGLQLWWDFEVLPQASI